MKAESTNPWMSRFSLLASLILTSSLIACGGDGGKSESAASTVVAASDDEAAEKYREKVKRRVSTSVVSSFSREWDVPESKVECLLADLSVTQLEDAGSDATVAAVFDKCGVDPAVVE